MMATLPGAASTAATAASAATASGIANDSTAAAATAAATARACVAYATAAACTELPDAIDETRCHAFSRVRTRRAGPTGATATSVVAAAKTAVIATATTTAIGLARVAASVMSAATPARKTRLHAHTLSTGAWVAAAVASTLTRPPCIARNTGLTRNSCSPRACANADIHQGEARGITCPNSIV